LLICPAASAPLWGGLPGVDQTLPLEALDGRVTVAAAATLWAQLRRRRLDAVLLCSAAAELRLAAYLAGVPRRLGPGGGPSAVLLTDRGAVQAWESPAATWLRLAGLLGIQSQLHAMQFEPGSEARIRATRMLIAGCGREGGRRCVAIAPGSGTGGRHGNGHRQDSDVGGGPAWEPERYALLANAIAAHSGTQVIVVGTEDERPTVEASLLDTGAGVVDFSGERDLRVTAAIIARCDVLVAADGPLLHLAAAVGTRSVGLFGPTDGVTRGPYGGDNRIVQAVGPAGDDDDTPMMERIRVEDVLAALDTLL
jgi:ADP-heptose:LPS heptosyltransferase